jgi:hypothetical protein
MPVTMLLMMPVTPQDSYTHRTDSGRQLTFATHAAARSKGWVGKPACRRFSPGFALIYARSQDSPECIAVLGAARPTVEG